MKSTAHKGVPAYASHPITTHSTIAVVGLGYVGLPLAIQAASRGFPVIGFDIDQRKIDAITAKNVDYLSSRDLARLNDVRTLAASANADDLAKATVYIICVPTPVSSSYEPDLKPLESASRTVAKYLKRGDLVSIESTINPGVCEEIALPILESSIERGSLLKVETDFYLVHCPERINPGDTQWDVRSIPRVIGGAGPASLSRGRTLYEGIIDGPVIAMQTLKEAEAVKMVENAFRDINIAFVNELAMAFDRGGIDLMNVIRGASSKPFSFMPHYPGAGVGGHCIPVDPYYLIRYGEQNGFMHTFLRAARSINNRMPSYTMSLLVKALRRKRMHLRGATITLLGLAYKRDISDERESPTHVIRELLEKRGAIVRVYDPYILGHSTHQTLDDALQGADAAIIATDHTEFRTLTPYHFMHNGVTIVVDGRNCLRKEDFVESGIHYSGIGRGSV